MELYYQGVNIADRVDVAECIHREASDGCDCLEIALEHAAAWYAWQPQVDDEIEAALDDANIGYYADYLKEYSKGTQFIVVTHRKGTMERCNSLFGVAMEEQGVSRMVSVSLQDYQE